MRKLFLYIAAILVAVNVCADVSYSQPTTPSSLRYWWDDDATATNIPITQNLNLDASSLCPGLHALHMQVADNTGVLANIVSKFFYIDHNKTKAPSGVLRYWWDDDATATNIPIAQNLNLDASSLCPGLHALHMQVADNTGALANIVSKFFYIDHNKEKTASGKLRYWVDEQSEIRQLDNWSNNMAIELPDIAYGMHTLYLELLDTHGHVVYLRSVLFYHSQSNAHTIPLADKMLVWYDNESQVSDTLDIASSYLLHQDHLALGKHTVHLQILHADGTRGIVESATFIKEPIIPIVIARLEIPVTADQWHYIAFPVDVDGADIEYAGNGTWGYYNSTLRASGVSGWQNVDPATTPLNANQGYIFYGDQDDMLYVNIDPATLPTANKSITLTDYPSFHADNENWNFVGNPYYATYNVSHIAPNGMNLYVWNGTGYYAKTAGHDSYTLQPLEAFFVQKKNTENSIDFVAASAGATAPARAWAANSNRYIDIAAVAGGYTDYTRVVLNETASEDYTVGYDLAKFFSDEAPIQLFTLDAQSIECGVQELPNGVEEIALGYTVLESGEVVISTTDMEETYYLYDAETGITTDLRQSNYTFTAEVGTTVNRLSLRRAPNAPTDVEHVDSVNKYVNTPTKLIRDGQVLILRGDRLFDLRGQEVK